MELTSGAIMRHRMLGFLAMGFAVLLDQGSKIFMADYLAGQELSMDLVPFLALRLSWNRGVSYSFLASAGDFGRYGLILLASFVILYLMMQIWKARSTWQALGLGLIAGGALGNVIDRVVHGAVEDFLYFHTPISLGPLSNYIFNIADAAIFCGVLCIGLGALRRPETTASS